MAASNLDSLLKTCFRLLLIRQPAVQQFAVDSIELSFVVTRLCYSRMSISSLTTLSPRCLPFFP